MAKAVTGLDESMQLRSSRRSSPAVLARPDAVEGQQMAAVADIALNPRNPKARSVGGDLDWLAASVAEIGVIAPVLLTSAEEWIEAYPEDAELIAGASWVLQDGHRRFEAAQRTGRSEVPYVRRGVDVDETVLRIATAYHSKKLTPLEEAVNFSWLIEHRSMSTNTIAKQTGLSQTYIARRMRLLDLPDAVQRAVDRGAMSLDAALRLIREADADLVARVGAGVAKRLEASTDGADDDQAEPQTPAPQITVQELLNEAQEARRVEEATQLAKASADDLGGEFVDDIKSRFPGTHKGHRLQSTAQIERAAAKNNLLVAPASYGTEPEYYAVVLEHGHDVDYQANREEALRIEAAAARAEALKQAVVQTIPSSLLQEALVRITLAGLGLSTIKAGPLAYRLAIHAGLASDQIGDWAWRQMLPMLPGSDQAKTAWIIALASIERLTEPAKAAWGPLQQWYFATLSRIAGYTPTPWEQARLDAFGKDAK